MRTIIPLLVLPLVASIPAIAAETVPVAPFNSVELRGGGQITVRPGPVQRITILDGSTAFTHVYMASDRRLRIDVCNNRCPRHYRLRVEVQSPNAPDLAVSGGGAIAVAGGYRPQPRLAAAVNGGGSIDARALSAANVSAAVNGGGNVVVNAQRSLSAAVNGGGAVRYIGNPRVSMAVRGGGMVGPAK